MSESSFLRILVDKIIPKKDGTQKMLDSLQGKGLTKSENPFVKEISESGTIAGMPIEKVEKRMRSTNYMTSGFLDKDESLVDVLTRDQQEVNRMGLTHKQISDPLQEAHNNYVLLSLQNPNWKDRREEILIEGQPFIMSIKDSRGVAVSPLIDTSNGSNGDWRLSTNSGAIITLENPRNKTESSFSDMLVHLIRDFGFYEGNVPYRVPPTEIAEFFELTKPLS